jgi:hypothetical protein
MRRGTDCNVALLLPHRLLAAHDGTLKPDRRPIVTRLTGLVGLRHSQLNGVSFDQISRNAHVCSPFPSLVVTPGKTGERWEMHRLLIQRREIKDLVNKNKYDIDVNGWRSRA